MVWGIIGLLIVVVIGTVTWAYFEYPRMNRLERKENLDGKNK